MMLTGDAIKERVANGDIEIIPFNPKFIGPNSYDVHLGESLLVYTNDVLDVKDKNETRSVIIPDEEGYVLQPGELYLGYTVERTKTNNLIPKLDGVSSNARLGISIHLTAGFGDIGFDGNWTLEITVVKPVRIYPGYRIGQIYFEEPERSTFEIENNTIVNVYKGKYQHSTGVIASRSFQDDSVK